MTAASFFKGTQGSNSSQAGFKKEVGATAMQVLYRNALAGQS